MSSLDRGIYEIYLQGSDGRWWDVLNGTQGLWLEQGALSLRMPDFTVISEDLASADGSYYQGITFGGFDVEATLMVGDPNSATHRRTGREWQLLDRAVYRSVGQLEQPLRWVVASSSGGIRSLWCQAGEARKPQATHEPHQGGLQKYRTVYTAHQPFYVGPEVRVPLTVQPAQGGISTARVFNSGERPAALVWDLVGPVSVSVGTSGSLATLPAIPHGRTATWDTFEHTLVTGDGESLRAAMQRDAPREPLPPGYTTLAVRREDSSEHAPGTVTARWRPLYLEPSA